VRNRKKRQRNTGEENEWRKKKGKWGRRVEKVKETLFKEGG